MKTGTVLLATLLMIAVGAPAEAGGKRKRRKRKRRAPVPVKPVPAVPETPKPDATPRAAKPAGPWAVGVSAQQKATARALLAEGNKLYLANEFKEAIAKYEEALKSWDHPAIRVNLVNALVGVGQHLKAYENLEKGLKYGKAPLEESVYLNALTVQRSLVALISTLNVSCETQGASVSLDGQALIATCPGKATRRTLPGRHQVVAQGPGYLTLTEDVVVMPGKTKDVGLKLVSIESATLTKRRWKRWKPWAVFGAGAALAGVGGLLELKAQSDLDSYAADIARLCSDKGCPKNEIPSSVRNLESRAVLEDRIAVGAMITGGVVAVGGVVMALMNRKKSYLPESASQPAKGAKASVSITPGGAYVRIGLPF